MLTRAATTCRASIGKFMMACLNVYSLILRDCIVGMRLTNLPGWAGSAIRFALQASVGMLYYGFGRYCPVCKRSSRSFRRYGQPPRDDARCVRCFSLERHRLTWLYFERHATLFDFKPKKILHIAPEACFSSRLSRRFSNDYVTLDLYRRDVSIRASVTKLAFQDRSFDIVYCSHVLEHVDDDRAAIDEFFRILKPGGSAIVLVPITVSRTYEDPTLVTETQRARAFGQKDHVRRYGRDFVERLRASGFNVTTIHVADVASHEEAIKMGLTQASGEVYRCDRPYNT